jgi:hypothetical protein
MLSSDDIRYSSLPDTHDSLEAMEDKGDMARNKKRIWYSWGCNGLQLKYPLYQMPFCG